MELIIATILLLISLVICAIIISTIADAQNLTHPLPNAHEKNQNTYTQGAVGEYLVAKELSNLRDTYTILTDYQIPNGGNIDVIVIGPTGIFIIDAKSHRGGSVTYDGDILRRNGNTFEKDFLKRIINQKMAIYHHLSKRLNINCFNAIQGVILFTDPRMDIHLGLRRVKNTYVIGLRWLRNLIEQKPAAHLNSNQIHDIVDTLSTRAVINRPAYLGITVLPKIGN